jgi:hypothetical protein
VVKAANILAYVRLGTQIVPTDAQGNWSCAAGLHEGNNRFVLTVRDALGNTTTDTLTVWYFDHTGPSVTVSPPTGTVSAVDSVLVQVTATDPSGISAVAINGTSANGNGSLWTRWVHLTGPSTLIRIVAIDSAIAQNATLDSITVRYDTASVDTTPPLVQITSPAADTTVFDTAGVSVRGIATDPGSGVARVVVNGVEASYDAQTGQWVVVVRPAADTLMVRAFAEDNAGHIAIDSVRIIRDNTPQTPQWRRDRIDVTLPEGATFMMSLPDSCQNPAAAGQYQFVLAGVHPYSVVSSGTYVFTAGVRSAGTHTDTLVAAGLPPNELQRDTMLVVVTVTPTTYQLTVASADSLGTVDPMLTGSPVRWGDTVLVTVIAGIGSEFDYWSGDLDVSDRHSAVLYVVMTGNRSLAAHFRPVSACRTVLASEDLNAVIRSVYSGVLPAQLCPEQGDYLNGTAKVKIVGKVRISFN